MARKLLLDGMTPLMGNGNGKTTWFDSTKYQTIESVGELKNVEVLDEAGGTAVDSQTLHNRTIGYRPAYADASDAYANHSKNIISFQHVPSQKRIYCKAFITSFNETYKSDWATEHVFGRIDPIYSFKNTGRSITLNFNMPAATAGEAFENLEKVGLLSDMLYPNYTSVGSAQTISQSPLIRMKVMNLLQSQRTLYNRVREIAGADGDWDWQLPQGRQFNSLSQGNNQHAAKGQLGVITSLTINHNLEKSDAGVIEAGKNLVLPKVIEVSISFDVIHEVPRGWNRYGVRQSNGGPYGLEHRAGENAQTTMRYRVGSEFSETVALNSQKMKDLLAAEEEAETGRLEELGAQAAQDAAEAKADTLLGRMRTTRAARKQMDFSERWQDRLGMSEWGPILQSTTAPTYSHSMASNRNFAEGADATGIGQDAID